VVRTKVELFAAIRRDSRLEGLSVRALARKYGVHRRMVREALSSAWPAPRKKLPPRKSRLDPFKDAIDRMLVGDLDAPRKQRHTVKRIFDRLVGEREMEGVSYGTVADYVRWRRPQVRVEAGRGPLEVFVPQTHRAGAEAEVDFGDVWINLAGESTKCYLFTFRMSYSGKAVHRVFASCGQEAFLEGHVHALSVLGGVPTGKVRYDNLRSAVQRVVGLSRSREEADRWVAFRSHYGLDAFYCQPGKEGAHEKGGVEGEVGRFRRNRLVPVPEVGSLAELNAMIDRWDEQDDHRRIGSRVRTVGDDFAVERPLLRALPTEPFETARVFTPRVDRYGQVTVRMNRYSVPVRLIGHRVRVLLGASELLVFDGRVQVARHERLATRGGTRLELDHYLEALLRKPGALPGATALEQARAAGRFTPVHDAWWAAVRAARGDAAGTRALVEVLLLHRSMGHEHVVAGIAAALTVGALTPEAVAVEARKAAQADTVSDWAATEDHHPTLGQVSSLTQRRLTALPGDTRPLPSVAAYDQLLRRPPAARPTHQGGLS
jgi:transposase